MPLESEADVIASLRRIRPRPVLDSQGLLRHRGRWVAISDAQLPLVARLVDDFGRVVPVGELAAIYGASGRATNAASMRTALRRLRHRFAEVGLVLRTVRRRGVFLDEGP